MNDCYFMCRVKENVAHTIMIDYTDEIASQTLKLKTVISLLSHLVISILLLEVDSIYIIQVNELLLCFYLYILFKNV